RAARAGPRCSCRRPAALRAPRRRVSSAPRAGQGALHRSAARSSPDAHALIRRQVQFLPRPHIESAVPGVDVANHAVDAEVRWAVRIARDLRAQVLIALLLPPDLRPGKEEALIAGEATQARRCLAVERAVISIV